MPIFAFGINYKTAPIEVREQMAFTPQVTAPALQDLIKLEAVNEAMILSTCNRTELYAEIEAGYDAPSLLKEWLAQQQRFKQEHLASHLY
ncbi:hypothetical protein ABI050_15130, partial [Enterococcus faecium]